MPLNIVANTYMAINAYCCHYILLSTHFDVIRHCCHYTT